MAVFVFVAAAQCADARLFASDVLQCGGFGSCARGRIYGPNVVMATGEGAMDSAVIHSCSGSGCDRSPADTVRDITIWAEGEGAMDGATLRCYGGSSCTVHCHGDACLGLKYQCYDGADCVCHGTGCPAAFAAERVAAASNAAERVEGHRTYSAANIVAESPLVAAAAVISVFAAMFYLVRTAPKGQYAALQ